MVLTQVTIDVLLKNSVLQTSKEGVDKLEFENAEFQEYLAAKEITRLSEPRRAAFSFAADPDAEEIYPSWFNTLSFLVDMDPEMLGQLLDFSGIQGDAFKVVDDAFLIFLSKVNPVLTPAQVRERIFNDVVNYHEKRLQWIPGQLTFALPGFFSAPLESSLKERVAAAETKTGVNRYVPLGNIAYVVAYLFRAKTRLDTPYWRAKLIQYASEPCENSVLARHALIALGWMGDPTVIDELDDLTQNQDELIARGFVSMCTELDPNNLRSVDYFIATTRKNDIHGRYGLYAMTSIDAIKHFLSAYNTDGRFRKEFLDDTAIFNEQDEQLVEHIRAVADAEIRAMAKEAIVNSVQYSVAHTRGKSFFISGLMAFLLEGDPSFVPTLVRDIRASEDGKTGLYFAQEFLSDILSQEDVPAFIDAMLEAGSEPWAIMNTMTRIKLKNTEASDAVYEAGRAKLEQNYREYEEARANPSEQQSDPYDERIIAEFRNALNPAPNQYMTRVFNDYNHAADKLELLMNDDDRARLDTLICDEALKRDPAQLGLTINEETDGGQSRNYTTSTAAIIYGDALAAAKRRGIDITPYRANIARFIPFAHNEELKTVFELVPDFTPEEINPLIEIYDNHDTDLWRWQPDNLIEAAEKYNLTHAVPILRTFVREARFRKYDRMEALSVAESLMSDRAFLREIVEEYLASENDDEREVGVTANGLLISKHADPDAVRWRLEQVKANVDEEPVRTSGIVTTVTTFDRELNNKEFAKSLMEFKDREFEEDYLLLLDRALEVWALGETYHAYGQYLWEIVYAYFDNLKEYGDYKPLRSIERKIAEVGTSQQGANWLAARMVALRRSYLTSIGKPSNFAEAIRKYNTSREYSDKKITNSADLYRHVQDAIDTDLRQWIEGEGAYELILTGKVYEAKKQEYEKLIQKTLKAQIENIMLKRGIRIEVLREPDLLDDKRVDFIIRYGFVGPIIVEVKLTSNSDIKARSVSGSKSYKSMDQYMRGYGASHGIFLIIVNSKATNLPIVKSEFEKIKGVTAVSLDCYKFAPPATSKKRVVARKKAAKKTSKKTKKVAKRK